MHPEHVREAGLYPRDLFLRSEHRRLPRSLRRVYGQRVIGEKREQNSGQRGVKGLRITIMRNVREVEN